MAVAGKVTGSCLVTSGSFSVSVSTTRNCSSQVWSNSLHQHRSLTNCREAIDFKCKTRRLDGKELFFFVIRCKVGVLCVVWKMDDTMDDTDC